jgi:carbamoyltransferase
MSRILGVSALYHDAAVALVEDGLVVAAAEEERFTRKKHDSSLPSAALRWLRDEHGLDSGVDHVVFYERPLVKLDRITRSGAGSLRGVLHTARGLAGFSKEKLLVESSIAELLDDAGIRWSGSLQYADHHLSHAASAFYPSAFDNAAVLCLDGVGEWASSSLWRGAGNTLEALEESHFPHSLGMFYATMTQLAGFKVNSGEYKLMGLAPYGSPRFADILRREVINVRDDGSVKLNMRYFDFTKTGRMANPRLMQLLGVTKLDAALLKPAGSPSRLACDIAASAQSICNDVMLKAAAHAVERTGYRDIALAGGVALNCVSVGNLLEQGVVDSVFVQPAASDAGGALGCALALSASLGELRRDWVQNGSDAMQAGFLGYELSTTEVEEVLEQYALVATHFDTPIMNAEIARLLAEGYTVAVCRGRAEFGPRALGNRSILADAREPECQTKLNVAVKKRESFRPFAPVVLESDASYWFEAPFGDPYMTTVAHLREELRIAPPTAEDSVLSAVERVVQKRSEIPAVTHVDYSARVQTVPAQHPLAEVLEAFKARTGVGVLVNTSFNRRGEPIVRSAKDAYRCFKQTELDYLVLGAYLIARNDNQHQGAHVESDDLELD